MNDERHKRGLTLVDILSLLKAYANQRNLIKGSELHAYIRKHKLLEENSHVSSSLVNMYARCGALAMAQQVLNRLRVRDVVAWNALIGGYVHQGQGVEALKCFDSMQYEGHSPTAATFTCALKACGRIRAAVKGKEIHYKIARMGMLEKDVLLGNTLVDMYARCGSLAKAQQVLEELPVRTTAGWTTLIAQYVQQGQGEEALQCFDIMQCEGHPPDAVMFTCVLKACGSIGAAAKGEQIHEKIVNLGMLEKDILVGTTLVDMYARCGVLAKAQQVLEELPVRDVVSWTALIAGYAQEGQGEEALKCFDRMQDEGHFPNAVTFACVLKACTSIRAVTKGEQIHEKIITLGMLEKDIVLGSKLVDMYARCGALDKARQVLENLPVQDAVMWTTLIAGYSQQGQGEEALKCFDRMQDRGHSPDIVTFMCALKACASIGAARKGEKIHDQILILDMLENNIELANTLVDMYARCGALEKARKVVEELPVRDVVTWNALIGGYAQQGQGGEALKCFDNMQCEGHSPDAVTFICALKACASIGAAANGEQIHEKIVCLGMLEKNIELGNMLVDMYVGFGALAKAQEVLRDLPVRDGVVWTVLIAGYAQQGQGEEALKCFDSMQQEGHSPDDVTLICVLKACASIGAVTEAEKIHGMIVKLGMLEKSVELGNSLVNMYARCGALAKAQQVLKELPVRNVVTWNALIAEQVQHAQGEEALKCLDAMECEGHSPDTITLAFALKACGILGAADKGKQIHEKIISLGVLERNVVLATALVDMYSKCAALAKAQQVLEELPVQDVVIWSALVAGFAQQGETAEAFQCFRKMQSQGVKPDSATLLSVLNACSHSGLSDQAEMLFSIVSPEFGITPDVEHYCCMVDLFGRAGKFDKMLSVIEDMPSPGNLRVWVSLLGACYNWANVKIGRYAFEQALHIDISNAVVYVSMSNVYIASGMQEDADKIELMRLANKAWNDGIGLRLLGQCTHWICKACTIVTYLCNATTW